MSAIYGAVLPPYIPHITIYTSDISDSFFLKPGRQKPQTSGQRKSCQKHFEIGRKRLQMKPQNCYNKSTE